MHEATGGKLQHKKVAKYGYKWNKNRIFKRMASSQMQNNEVKQLDFGVGGKTLGACIACHGKTDSIS